MLVWDSCCLNLDTYLWYVYTDSLKDSVLFPMSIVLGVPLWERIPFLGKVFKGCRYRLREAVRAEMQSKRRVMVFVFVFCHCFSIYVFDWPNGQILNANVVTYILVARNCTMSGKRRSSESCRFRSFVSISTCRWNKRTCMSFSDVYCSILLSFTSS